MPEHENISPNDGQKWWFVLNFIRPTISPKDSIHSAIDTFNSSSPRVELFAPKILHMEIKKGEVKACERPLTFHYVFVRGTFDDVKSLCGQPNGFSFVLDKSSDRRYATLSDEAMESFRIIARSYENTLPFYNIEDIDLQAGDLVEVLDGEFAGIKGVFIPKPKSKRGNIVLSASADLGTIAWNVEAQQVRVLEFAKCSKRAYDQIDAIIPKLFAALRKYHDGAPLTRNEITNLQVFCRRMECVRIDNQKFEAKLLAVLTSAMMVLGNIDQAKEYAARYERRSRAITNQQTTALVDLILGIAFKDMDRVLEGYCLTDGLSKSATGMQRALSVEYRHYLNCDN